MQRTFLCLCLFALAQSAFAQGDKAKPNTLTPKEIADGWILLFDGETTLGWQVTSTTKKGSLKVGDGALDLSDLGRITIACTTQFKEFELRFECAGADDRNDGGSLFTRGTDTEGRKQDREFHITTLPKQWVPFAVRFVDGEIEFGMKRSGFLWRELTTFEFEQSSEKARFRMRNIKLRPLNTTSLFNGKDLAGWKTFPGEKYKSKFSVNDKGELNVKDGPGDLQTVGKYKDFILQLECISNGKHLNSGVFFRCRDNEYQNGYEAQIRNQFTAEPTQKYLIEEYDPKTNKLVGKKEILSTAFDFGTGSIYRRVPARKEMSKDGEWFAMTVAAQGNHFATWVNGVQVTDWTDNRPKTDNARTGCKLEAGHLSIQGHDPTTDLSFRNLRIAEIK